MEVGGSFYYMVIPDVTANVTTSSIVTPAKELALRSLALDLLLNAEADDNRAGMLLGI
jgi:hypothetical protein